MYRLWNKSATGSERDQYALCLSAIKLNPKERKERGGKVRRSGVVCERVQLIGVPRGDISLH